MTKKTKLVCRVCGNKGWVQSIKPLAHLGKFHLGWEEKVHCLFCTDERNPNFEEIAEEGTLQ
jgi:hypothetical protein